MLNRSKIIIDVDSFIHAQTFRIQVVHWNRIPKSRLDDRVNYQQQTSTRAPRRTAPFPNGDVRKDLTALGPRSEFRNGLRLAGKPPLNWVLLAVPAGIEPATFRV
jgi:hypothetical protein